METSDLHPDHRELIELLASHHVEFLLVGSYALAFHGVSRYTEDLDLWIRRSVDNASRVRQALEDFGIAIDDQAEAELQEDRRLLQFGLKPQRIDILTFLDGCEFDQAYTRSSSVEIDKQSIRLLSLEDFVATKKASARQKDFDDLNRLREVLGHKLPGDD